MQVSLAGYNIDVEIIEQIARIINEYPYDIEDFDHLTDLLTKLSGETLSPETVAAAYARISRSDKDVKELRREARFSISRTRRTNERIVFGYGHATIAEHAIVNLDITGISRLAIEELESHRLASYTEASQRYIAMTGDFIIPQEVIEAGLEERFRSDCEELFSAYRDLTDKLERKYANLPDRDRNTKTREDARYVLPLASRSQVGVTINARTAEWMIRNFNRSPLAEVRDLGQQMLSAIKRIVPSLIKHTEPNRSLEAAQSEIAYMSQLLVPNKLDENKAAVELIEAPLNDELNALASILFSSGYGSFSRCLSALEKMNSTERETLLIAVHKCISVHEPLRRELELGHFTFSITLSSSAFAQFKRHRIATLIKQRYLPELGVVVPDSIIEVNGEDIFHHSTEVSNNLFELLQDKLNDDNKYAAQYALTNAHKRRVIFKANARELTHFSRLREDTHAQWDIRGIANEMIRLARKACPALMLFASGKDSFDTLSEKLFGNNE